jgi:AraC-like DNA-binding protein
MGSEKQKRNLEARLVNLTASIATLFSALTGVSVSFAVEMLMVFQTYLPKAPLSDFVEMLWAYEGYITTHEKERLLPTGTAELVINLREDQTRIYNANRPQTFETRTGSVICGIHSKPFVIDTETQFSVIGVHFKPGGFFPFFPFPAMELHNCVLSLEDVWSKTARELRERLLETGSPQLRFQILENFLLKHARKSLSRHCAVGFALKRFQQTPHTETISSVVERTGFSQRRFIEAFSNEVGVTPKLFCRIQRFQNVIQGVHKKENVQWLETALDNGFFDQAHFIRDFREFSGINPSAYLKQRGEHLNHVPII